MTSLLKSMNADIVRHLDVPFRLGSATIDGTQFTSEADVGREIDLAPLRAVMDEGMRKFESRRALSDTWIGPRLHSVLRLTRREAALRGIWRYLAIEAFSDYVRWRWTREKNNGDLEPPALDRFVGPDYKHALGRLWWMAEVFRNGSDYGPASRALSIQDIANNLFRMDIAHHRPTALGCVDVLIPSDGPALTGREANALAKAANATATTVAFDVFAPDEPLDDTARESWAQDARDLDVALLLSDEALPGPEDPNTPPDSLKSMTNLLRELLAEAPVRGRKPRTNGHGPNAENDETPAG
jgi:Family of unknown function (DUF6339)